MSRVEALLHEPYDDQARQREAYAFGMWAFLASEVLFFGGLFFTYAFNRARHPAEVMEAARHAEFVFGTINVFALLTSGMALSVAERAQVAGRARLSQIALWVSLALGLAFLAVKGIEYAQDLKEHLWPGPDFELGATPAMLFWGFYWVATGTHAIHVTIGLGLIVRLILLTRSKVSRHAPSFTTTSLYWSLVDIVWVTLYPLIYLVGRPG